MLEAGIISEIKPPITDLAPYENRRAVPIQGEPISETVIQQSVVSSGGGFFLDTSAVLKRYVQETGTAWMQALAAPIVRHSLFVVRITLAEAVAAITRRERGGSITQQPALPYLSPEPSVRDVRNEVHESLALRASLEGDG